MTPILITRSYVTALCVQGDAIPEYALVSIIDQDIDGVAYQCISETAISRGKAMEFVRNRQLVKVADNKYGVIYDTPDYAFRQYCNHHRIRYAPESQQSI